MLAYRVWLLPSTSSFNNTFALFTVASFLEVNFVSVSSVSALFSGSFRGLSGFATGSMLDITHGSAFKILIVLALPKSAVLVSMLTSQALTAKRTETCSPLC